MQKIHVAVIAAGLMTLGTAMQAQADGAAIYNTKCMACHASGAAGAPKLGDKAAWAPRIATGRDALIASVINGKNAMPPKGACMDCSDEDLAAAVDHMISGSQ